MSQGVASFVVQLSGTKKFDAGSVFFLRSVDCYKTAKFVEIDEGLQELQKIGFGACGYDKRYHGWYVRSYELDAAVSLITSKGFQVEKEGVIIPPTVEPIMLEKECSPEKVKKERAILGLRPKAA